MMVVAFQKIIFSILLVQQSFKKIKWLLKYLIFCSDGKIKYELRIIDKTIKLSL